MFLSAFAASKPLVPATDPFWNDVLFLQTFDNLTVGSLLGANWVNQKSNPAFPISGAGNFYQVASSPALSGNSIQQTASGNPVFSLGANTIQTLTFEASFYSVYYPENGFVFLGAGASITYSGGVFQIVITGTSYTYGQFIVGTWFDFAIVSTVSTTKVFINGVLAASKNTTPPLVSSFTLPRQSVASDPIPQNVFYTDEVRLTKAARYSTNYTPSHPFLTQ